VDGATCWMGIEVAVAECGQGQVAATETPPLDRRWLMGGVRGEVVGDDRCPNQSQRGHMAGVGMVVRSAT
jgi:hypothetical protein